MLDYWKIMAMLRDVENRLVVAESSDAHPEFLAALQNAATALHALARFH